MNRVLEMLEAHEAVAAEAPHGVRSPSAAKAVNESFGFAIDKWKSAVRPEKHHLFVSPVVWPLFSTCRSLLFEALPRLKLKLLDRVNTAQKEGSRPSGPRRTAFGSAFPEDTSTDGSIRLSLRRLRHLGQQTRGHLEVCKLLEPQTQHRPRLRRLAGPLRLVVLPWKLEWQSPGGITH